MEVAVIVIIFTALGMMPLISFYFGWLGGRPFRDRFAQLALYGYLIFLALTGMGFAIGVSASAESMAHRAVLVPTGILLVVSPTLSIWFFFSALGRVKRGHCPKCGYDWRGNTSGRCPECGAKVHSPVD